MGRIAPRSLRFERGAIGAVAGAVGALYFLAVTPPPAVPPAPPLIASAPAVATASPPAQPPRAAPVERAQPARFVVATAAKLRSLFEHLDYNLERVRSHGEVPPIMLASLPPDMPDIDAPDRRKQVFIKAALPLILRVNERIMADRARVIAYQAEITAGGELSGAEERWLETIAAAYGLERVDIPALLRRIDVVPPSLAVAQAAEESGWGTSRFAHEGNALFGQRIFGDGNGIVPADRDNEETHRVRAFEQLLDGVQAYAFNLNTHRAYDSFRKARAAQRGSKGRLDGYALADTLERYSERGKKYVVTLRRIIRANALTELDHAWLKAPGLPRLAPFRLAERDG